MGILSGIFLELKLVLLDKTQMKFHRPTFAGLLPAGRFLSGPAPAVVENNPLLGCWSLHFPEGSADWLGATRARN
jgi:hypothetical protein